MTKYEWETELKKNIHRLPKEEIVRVMEYYDELFADKIERGYGESEIVTQFGNPVDVADKILSEYDGDLGDNEVKTDTPELSNGNEKEAVVRSSESDERVKTNDNIAEQTPMRPQTASEVKIKREFKAERFALFFLINAVTGFAAFFILGSVWICLASFIITSGALAVGGVGMTLLSLFEFGRGIGSAVAQLGMGIAFCGIGIGLTVGFVKLTVLAGKATGKIFGAVKNWIYPQKEAVA